MFNKYFWGMMIQLMAAAIADHFGQHMLATFWVCCAAHCLWGQPRDNK